MKIILFNNGSLGFVALEMQAAGYLDTGTDLENPAVLEEGLGAMLTHDGPALLDGVTAKQELVLPPKIQLEQAKGFSLFLLKTIINGRGDEVVERERTNLLR